MHRCVSAQGVEAIFARRKQEDSDRRPTHVAAHAASKSRRGSDPSSSHHFYSPCYVTRNFLPSLRGSFGVFFAFFFFFFLVSRAGNDKERIDKGEISLDCVLVERMKFFFFGMAKGCWIGFII